MDSQVKKQDQNQIQTHEAEVKKDGKGIFLIQKKLQNKTGMNQVIRPVNVLPVS